MKPFTTLRRTVVAGAIATLGLSATLGPAIADEYPSKPVTMIIPYGAGGSTDTMGRVFAKALGEELGQPVVVVNRKGGGGSVGASFLKNASPDGYTVLLGAIDEILAWNTAATDVDFAMEDFRAIGAIANYQAALVASVDQPFSTLPEFVEYAKANPGTAVATQGGMSAKFIDRMAQQEGLEFRMVNANSGSEAMQLLLAGNAVMSFSGGVHASYAGKIGVLASMNETRLAGYPDKPTFQEAGYGLAMPSMLGMIAPENVPDDVAAKIETALVTAAADEDLLTIVEERLKSQIEVLSGADAQAIIQEMGPKLAPLAAE